MSTQAIVDFLTKQIFIERNIVTYRSLSRDLRIHVNTAKNELAAYHDVAPYQSQTCVATYLMCGEPFLPRTENDAEDVDMDTDIGTNEDAEYEDDGEEMPQTRILLVNEQDFEGAKSQFARLDSIHVYSLSPSPIPDAGLICTPTVNIRAIDRGKDGVEVVRIVGKIVGASIKVQPLKAAKAPHPPVAGPSRLRVPLNAATTQFSDKRKPVVKEPVKEQPKAAVEKLEEKPKATGKLDFSRATTKDTKKSEAIPEPKDELKVSKSKSEVKNKKAKEKLGPPKRGTKRKSAVSMSDSEDDDMPAAAPSQPPSSHSSYSEKVTVRIQKRTVISDDDEEDVLQPVQKPSRMGRPKKTADSDAELNVKTLMDIDDDQVIRVTREAAISLRKEEEEESAEDDAANQDVEMVDDSVLKPKPKKRREKKVVPVGRNGLKKKRVVKSRQLIDAKGYTVFEDYSSYESVSEEEPETAAPAKGKAKTKGAKSQAKQEDSPAPAPKLKPMAKGAQGGASTKNGKSNKAGGAMKGPQKQNSLANFFMAKPK